MTPLHRRTRGGFALVTSLLLVVIVTGSLGLLFYALESSVRVSRHQRHQLQSFYACDGLDRIVVSLLDDYVSEATGPDADGLEAWICSAGGGCDSDLLPELVPEGFELTDFAVATKATGQVSPMATGPFRGLQSEQTVLEVTLDLVKPHEELPYRCEIARQAAIGRVSGTQFFLRSEGYTDWFPDQEVAIDARVHVNGDFCLGSRDGLRLGRMTASGSLLHPTHDDCLTDRGTPSSYAEVATGAGFESFEVWSEGTDHGCTSCGGTDADWTAWAQATWRGRVLDSAHGVVALRPDVSSVPAVQQGADALGVPLDNTETVRFAVEPLPDATDPEVLRSSLAHQAHLRIINGVWYLQDPEDPTAWPGVPIWSDHPGHLMSEGEEGVEAFGMPIGQEDIAQARGWKQQPPHRYSYYRFNPANGKLHVPTPSRTYVLSYGSLTRLSDDTWGPARWVDPGMRPKCKKGSGKVLGLVDAWTPAGCGEGASPTARHLDATRGGFRDPQVEQQADSSKLANILPMNFDVAAFLEALADDGRGELGSYFCEAGDGCFMDEPFNGVVWISATWPGSMAGVGDGHPLSWPAQGDQGPLPTAPQLVGPGHDASQQALPMPLCTSDRSYVGKLLTGGSFFVAPSCDDYGYGDPDASGAARPNAVRIFHAADLLASDKKKGPILDQDGDGRAEGLTIASNLPVYLLGPTNVTSDASDPDAESWTPFYVAADQVTLLSSAWDDASSPWGVDAADTFGDRQAADTTFHVSVLGGWSPSAEGLGSGWSGGVLGFLRTIEDWSGATATFRGALDIGFASVHHRWPPSEDEDVAAAPTWDLAHDPHLTDLDNSPPGAPTYVVHGPTRWQGR